MDWKELWPIFCPKQEDNLWHNIMLDNLKFHVYLHQSMFVGSVKGSSRRDLICSRTWKNYKNLWASAMFFVEEKHLHGFSLFQAHCLAKPASFAWCLSFWFDNQRWQDWLRPVVVVWIVPISILVSKIYFCLRHLFLVASLCQSWLLVVHLLNPMRNTAAVFYTCNTSSLFLPQTYQTESKRQPKFDWAALEGARVAIFSIT